MKPPFPAKPGPSGRQAKPTQHAKRVMNNESFSPLIELGGRKVAEWIGSHPDAAIPKRVKLRILLRCGGKCHRSGHKFRPGDPIEFDHIVALCNGGEHREFNIAPILGGKVHQAKTRADIDERVKTDRIRAKNAGLWPKPKRPLKSRGFERGRNANFSSTNKG